jgi:hypothetical protein
MKSAVTTSHNVWELPHNHELYDVVNRCTNGRPHATTEQYGFLTNTATQTVRKNYSQTGECFGIKPIKIGNRLFWPTPEIIRLLGGA